MCCRKRSWPSLIRGRPAAKRFLVAASWHSGPEGQLHKTAEYFPWVDGRIVLVIGTVPPRKLAVEL
jgi:hypothetical protein